MIEGDAFDPIWQVVSFVTHYPHDVAMAVCPLGAECCSQRRHCPILWLLGAMITDPGQCGSFPRLIAHAPASCSRGLMSATQYTVTRLASHSVKGEHSQEGQHGP